MSDSHRNNKIASIITFLIAGVLFLLAIYLVYCKINFNTNIESWKEINTQLEKNTNTYLVSIKKEKISYESLTENNKNIKNIIKNKKDNVNQLKRNLLDLKGTLMENQENISRSDISKMFDKVQNEIEELNKNNVTDLNDLLLIRHSVVNTNTFDFIQSTLSYQKIIYNHKEFKTYQEKLVKSKHLEIKQVKQIYVIIFI